MRSLNIFLERWVALCLQRALTLQLSQTEKKATIALFLEFGARIESSPLDYTQFKLKHRIHTLTVELPSRSTCHHDFN